MATDTGCLYGLTFVTHFYGASKSILAPQLGTAELMSGQVVEGTRAAIEVAAKELSSEADNEVRRLILQEIKLGKA